MSVGLAATATYVPTAATAAVVLTLGASPAAGTLLIANVAYSEYAATRAITLPTGWTLLGNLIFNSAAQAVFGRIAGASEPTTVTFPITGSSNDWASGELLVFSGNAAALPTVFAQNGYNSAAPYTPSLAPPVVGALPVALFSQDTNNYSGGELVSATGWTLSASAVPTYHPSFAFTQAPVAALAALQCVATPATPGNATDYVSALLYVAPLAAVAPPTGSNTGPMGTLVIEPQPLPGQSVVAVPLGGTQQFVAVLYAPDGSSSIVPATWATTGGSISATGLLTAPSTLTPCVVTATQM